MHDAHARERHDSHNRTRKNKRKRKRSEKIPRCTRETKQKNANPQKRPHRPAQHSFPSQALPESNDSTAGSRKTRAAAYVSELLVAGQAGRPSAALMKHLGEVGSVPWRFTHLELLGVLIRVVTSYRGIVSV